MRRGEDGSRKKWKAERRSEGGTEIDTKWWDSGNKKGIVNTLEDLSLAANHSLHELTAALAEREGGRGLWMGKMAG